MPWRSIDSVASTTEPPPAERAGSVVGLSRGTFAVAGAAILVAVATFLIAFGSGAGGAVEVTGGGGLGDATVLEPSPRAPGVGPVTEPAGELVVEIVGAVARPGVYRLPRGARVGDLVDAAGGYGPRVDTAGAARVLNLAAAIQDGGQIRVPSRDDVAIPGDGGAGATGGAAEPGGGATTATTPVDLNRATSAELEALPGIGPATAAKIIAAREEARFVSVDDLLTRKVVGQKTFDGLHDLVTVG